MSDLVSYEHEPSPDDQLRAALEKALIIQGTVINDLESAINCIMQMERALSMVGAPNPHDATVKYLKEKYKMGRDATNATAEEWRKLLGPKEPLHPIQFVEGKDEPLELLEGEIVDD